MVSEIEFDEEEYRSLPPDKKEKRVFQTINSLLHNHPEGLTRSDIQEVTPFGRKTIDKHLEKLVALNEGYVRRRGGTDVYYPNGKLLHDGVNDKKELNGKTFQIKHLENVSGKLVYIQEIEDDEYGSEQVKGGLLIPQNMFSDFTTWLREAADKMEVSEND